MQSVAAWLVARPQNAILALASTLLLPLLQIFGGAIMVLLVLRQGVRLAVIEGAIAGVFLVLVVACGGGDDESATPTADDALPGRGRLIATASPLPVIDSPSDIPEGLAPVWETFAAIAREYVERDNIDPQVLARGAIRGMLDALDDPYTAYVTPEGYKRQLESFQGDFEGIGAQIDNTPDGQRIFRHRLEGSIADGVAMGEALAKELLDRGGADIVSAIRRADDT